MLVIYFLKIYLQKSIAIRHIIQETELVYTHLHGKWGSKKQLSFQTVLEYELLTPRPYGQCADDTTTYCKDDLIDLAWVQVNCRKSQRIVRTFFRLKGILHTHNLLYYDCSSVVVWNFTVYFFLQVNTRGVYLISVHTRAVYVKKIVTLHLFMFP